MEGTGSLKYRLVGTSAASHICRKKPMAFDTVTSGQTALPEDLLQLPVGGGLAELERVRVGVPQHRLQEVLAVSLVGREVAVQPIGRALLLVHQVQRA